MTSHNRKIICSNQDIAKQYLAGKTMRQLAEKYGVTIPAIHWILKYLNIPRRSNSEAHKGQIPWNYKGGWIDSQGYHCQWIKGRTVRTHRLKIKSSGTVVHHINGNRSDNRPENLEILPSQSEHMKRHMTSEEARKRGAKGLISRYGRATIKAAQKPS